MMNALLQLTLSTCVDVTPLFLTVMPLYTLVSLSLHIELDISFVLAMSQIAVCRFLDQVRQN